MPAEPTCEHRAWLETDEDDATGPMCGKPATHRRCDPVDQPVCEEHKCRHNYRLEKPMPADPNIDALIAKVETQRLLILSKLWWNGGYLLCAVGDKLEALLKTDLPTLLAHIKDLTAERDEARTLKEIALRALDIAGKKAETELAAERVRADAAEELATDRDGERMTAEADLAGATESIAILAHERAQLQAELDRLRPTILWDTPYPREAELLTECRKQEERAEKAESRVAMLEANLEVAVKVSFDVAKRARAAEAELDVERGRREEAERDKAELDTFWSRSTSAEVMKLANAQRDTAEARAEDLSRQLDREKELAGSAPHVIAAQGDRINELLGQLARTRAETWEEAAMLVSDKSRLRKDVYQFAEEAENELRQHAKQDGAAGVGTSSSDRSGDAAHGNTAGAPAVPSCLRCPKCAGTWIDVNDVVTDEKTGPRKVADCCKCGHEWWLTSGRATLIKMPTPRPSLEEDCCSCREALEKIRRFADAGIGRGPAIEGWEAAIAAADRALAGGGERSCRAFEGVENWDEWHGCNLLQDDGQHVPLGDMLRGLSGRLRITVEEIDPRRDGNGT